MSTIIAYTVEDENDDSDNRRIYPPFPCPSKLCFVLRSFRIRNFVCYCLGSQQSDNRSEFRAI